MNRKLKRNIFFLPNIKTSQNVVVLLIYVCKIQVGGSSGGGALLAGATRTQHEETDYINAVFVDG